MESAASGEQTFRFLDLPAELRGRVYEQIHFPSTWHVLDRTQASIEKMHWPIPPKAQIYDSRVTLIRPHAPVAILFTCRLVLEEARTILKRKMEHCKAQPIRYLVDYSAALALTSPARTLSRCLGIAGGFLSAQENTPAGDFVQTCARYLSQTRWQQDGSRGVRAIDMTITHKSGIVYVGEVWQTMEWLQELKYYAPTRLVVIYKSPLPHIQLRSDMPIHTLSDWEKSLRNKLPEEPGIGEQVRSERGIFVKPLKEYDFEKHVEGLEWY